MTMPRDTLHQRDDREREFRLFRAYVGFTRVRTLAAIVSIQRITGTIQTTILYWQKAPLRLLTGLVRSDTLLLAGSERLDARLRKAMMLTPSPFHGRFNAVL
jgi:hypothetical protein